MPRVPAIGKMLRRKHNNVLATLDMAIGGLNLAKDLASATPASAVFVPVRAILVMVRDTLANKQGYVDVGLACANICTALVRGIDGKPEALNQPVLKAIDQLKTAVAEIERNVTKQSRRNPFVRLFHARTDKDLIDGWMSELNRILHVFNTELAITTTAMLGVLLKTSSPSIPGESPPPAPTIFFGREELTQKVVDLAEEMKPIALVGTGGIGKTCVARSVIHHNSIERRFGDNRRFVRCDQFTASRPNFLRCLSKAIGAGIENPENLGPLRSCLASREMFIVLDNAESILDSKGTDGREIYEIVEELSQFSKICLVVTSRIRIIPPNFEHLDIPTISMNAARSTFHGIYKNQERSQLIDDILTQLDFHPLSVTLLATVAYQNQWNGATLIEQWRKRQTNVLQTEHGRNLAETIELSLSSPMFKALGADARELLQVIAFFPQGVSEKNFHWLFPTISGGISILNKFCNLSLTYRSDGFVTMLAPLRDYLRLNDPKSSPLLHITKMSYFTKMSVEIECHIQDSFEDSKWITLEDANVEHLLNVFTTIDRDSDDVWKACANFMKHLHWHKQRTTVLRPKVEALHNDHPFKPVCLFELSRVLQSIGIDAGRIEILSRAVKLEKQRGDVVRIGLTLLYLADASLELGLYEEGTKQAREALDLAEIYGTPVQKAGCLNMLAWLLYGSRQVDDAEKAAIRALSLLPENGQEFLTCQSHRVLGEIAVSNENRGEAIRHFKEALRIASPFSWLHHVIWVHHSLALLFAGEGKFDEAQTHVEQAESHTFNNIYFTGRTALVQARILYQRRRFAEAKSQALRARQVFEKLEATKGQEVCESFLQSIDEAMDGLPTSEESGVRFHWYTIQNQGVNAS